MDKGLICRPGQPSRDVCCLGGARIQDAVETVPKPAQPSDFCQGKPVYAGAVEMESSFAEKELGILMDIMSQQRALAAKKVNGIFAYMRQSTASRSKEVIIYSGC